MNIGSRSQVKDLVKKGTVSVNDEVVKKSDIHIDPFLDEVKFQSQIIQYEKYVYYMLHKPAGVVSATEDNFQKTVIDLLKDENRKDLFPIGRLDKDTEGLLLITNDGDLAHRLLSPKKHVPKKYFAIINGNLTKDGIDQLEHGLDIGEDQLTLPAQVVVEYKKEVETGVSITITEGKFHQVKRMFQSVGCEVVYLKRLSMGQLELDETLPLGSYRPLTMAERKLINSKE